MSMLKRGCHGVCHKMSWKHLQRYVNKFAGRINIRDKAPLTRDRRAFCNLVGQRLMYTDLTALTKGGLSSRHLTRKHK